MIFMKLPVIYMVKIMSSEQPPVKTGLWYLTWRWVGMACLALTVHIMMASMVWSDHHEHLHQILLNDMKIIAHIDHNHSAYLRAELWANQAFYWIFEATGFNGMVREFSTVSVDPFGTEVRKLVVFYWSEIQAAMYSVQIIAERSSVLFSTWPLIILVTVIASADGWSARWLRRAHGGRESAFLYHRLKRGIFLSIVLMWGTYLIWMTSIDPRMIILPFVLIYGVLLRFTFSYFKKYF